MWRPIRKFLGLCRSSVLTCMFIIITFFGRNNSSSFIQYASAQIQVISPSTLVQEFAHTGLPTSSIPGSTATFGAPTYGALFEGRLWYIDDPDEQYCTKDYVAKIKKLQEEFGKSASGGTDMSHSVRNVFLLRRGKCAFVTKVSIAEKEGLADCVLIVDEESSSWTRTNVQHVIMADNGNGFHVNIPSILVTNTDGNMLINAVKYGMQTGKNIPVIVKIEWALPQKSVVRVDYWTDAGRRNGAMFLREFAPHAKLLRGRLSFTTHYNVFSMPFGGDTSDICLTNAANFCDNPPVTSQYITGREVLLENLRQLCIWDRTATPVEISDPSAVGQQTAMESELWWKYVEQFPIECPSWGTQAESPTINDRRLGESCSSRLMKQIKIDHVAIESCARSDSTRILQQQLGDKAWSVIALRINDVRFNGNMDPILVMRAICSAFEETPKECKAYLDNSLLNASSGQGSGGISFGRVMFVLLCISCTVVGFLWLHQRYVHKSMRNSLRHEVMLEVKAQMQEYYQMSDDTTLDDFRQSRPLAR
eukprot:Lankesteria_metandrocarpae@DN9387_c0_g1_i1.p1